MIGVNLIPPAVLHARRRARHMRRWAVAVVATAAISAVPLGLELRRHARLSSLVDQRTDDADRLASARQELAALTADLEKLEKRIDRANTLRTKRPWQRLLAGIAACMPEEIWLTALRTEGQRARKPNAQGSKAAAQTSPSETLVVLAGARRISLTGYALNHDYLYDFMTRLRRSNAFARVQLTQADKEKVMQGQAIRFWLECGW